MSAPALSAEAKAETLRLHAAGLSFGAIGQQLGISRTAAYRRLRQLGYVPNGIAAPHPLRKPGISSKADPLVRQIVQSAQAQGMTLKALEKRAGVSNASLWSWRRGQTPNIALLAACAEVVGLKLALVPIDPSGHPPDPDCPSP